MSQKKKSRAERAAEGRRRQKAAVRRDAEGRVHLTFERDRASGRPRLALTEPVFEADWQNQLVEATANTALGTLAERPTVALAVELARGTLAAASALAENFSSQLPAGSLACEAGCAHCCHQVVAVTAPEALAVVEHLKRTRSSAELDVVAARVRTAAERGRGLTTSERFSRQHPCPFLEAGQCSIYEARPLACRGMNSRDANGCARVLDDPAARAEVLASPSGGHSFAEPLRAAYALSAGLQVGLSEVYRLDMQPLELTGAVDLLLSGSSSLAARWIAGETPFVTARASDETNDARMRALSGLLAPLA